MAKQIIVGIDIANEVRDMAREGMQICRPCFDAYAGQCSQISAEAPTQYNDSIVFAIETLGHLLGEHTCIGDNDMADGNERYYCRCACAC